MVINDEGVGDVAETRCSCWLTVRAVSLLVFVNYTTSLGHRHLGRGGQTWCTALPFRPKCRRHKRTGVGLAQDNQPARDVVYHAALQCQPRRNERGVRFRLAKAGPQAMFQICNVAGLVPGGRCSPFGHIIASTSRRHEPPPTHYASTEGRSRRQAQPFLGLSPGVISSTP